MSFGATDEDWNDAPEDSVDEFDDEEDSDNDLLLCPNCRESVHEDTQKCPHCGDWITPVHPGGAWKRWVWAVAAILVAASMLLMTVL